MNSRASRDSLDDLAFGCESVLRRHRLLTKIDIEMAGFAILLLGVLVDFL